MNTENSQINLEWHKQIAQETFNSVWELMEKPDRTVYETVVMIHMAHTSVYHWSFVGEAVNMARGEWQVSRAYCVAKMPESALFHAHRSLEICQNNRIGGFDLAFCYEAVARALKLSGDFTESQQYLTFAQEAALQIEKEEDRQYFLSELETIYAVWISKRVSKNKEIRSLPMESFNDCMREYTNQLHKARIQKAYKGLMTFMSSMKTYMEKNHPEFFVSTVYPGYMDMTYFAFTPNELKQKQLKIAVVYLHEAGKFEAWLGGTNRKIQAEYIAQLIHKDIDQYRLSQVCPGVDSIIETTLIEDPDFDDLEALKIKIEQKTMKFANDMIALLV